MVVVVHWAPMSPSIVPSWHHGGSFLPLLSPCLPSLLLSHPHPCPHCLIIVWFILSLFFHCHALILRSLWPHHSHPIAPHFTLQAVACSGGWGCCCVGGGSLSSLFLPIIVVPPHQSLPVIVVPPCQSLPIIVVPPCHHRHHHRHHHLVLVLDLVDLTVIILIVLIALVVLLFSQFLLLVMGHR